MKKSACSGAKLALIARVRNRGAWAKLLLLSLMLWGWLGSLTSSAWAKPLADENLDKGEIIVTGEPAGAEFLSEVTHSQVSTPL